jgi:DNA-binding winged helix-turn-helix (wHTH) protein
MFMKSAAGVLRINVEHIVYVFEGFRLDAGRRQLSSSGGVVIALNSRAMEALVILVARAGELVTKRQLLEGVWPGAVVEDNNINQCVLAIRKVLGETAGSNRFIMTVPGRGYRFVAPVIVQRRESPEIPSPESQVRSSNARWKTFALPGITAAMILALIAVEASREDILPPQVAEQSELVVHLRRNAGAPADLQTDTLLACLRQRPDLHLQVEVHVVGAESGPPLWTGQYIAGAQDLLPDAKQPPTDANACRQLAAR